MKKDKIKKKLAKDFIKRAKEMDKDPKMREKCEDYYEKTTTRFFAKR